jgi:hypothetical protein
MLLALKWSGRLLGGTEHGIADAVAMNVRLDTLSSPNPSVPLSTEGLIILMPMTHAHGYANATPRIMARITVASQGRRDAAHVNGLICKFARSAPPIAGADRGLWSLHNNVIKKNVDRCGPPGRDPGRDHGWESSRRV